MPKTINRNTVLSIVVSLSLILYLFSRIEFSDFVRIISNINIVLFIIACLISLPNNATRAYRWSRVLKAQKINLSLLNSLKYFIMALFAAVLTPGRVGDLLRAYLVSRREKKTFGYITASVVFDRILDLGTMLAIATFGVLLFFTPEQMENLNSAILLLVIFAVLGAFLVYIVFSTDFGKSFLLKIGRGFIGLMPKRFAQKVDLDNELNDFFVAIDLYRSNYGNLIVAAVCSFAAWAIYGFQGYILFLAFGGDQNVSFLVIMFFVAFAAFATLIPFTISGIGAREAIFIMLFGSIGIAEATALSFSLVFIAIASWIPAIFGGVLLGKEGLGKPDIAES